MLKDIKIEDVHAFEDALFEHLVATKDELLAEIRDTGILSPDRSEELREAITAVKEKYFK
jgi:F0F1-type ATP synthase alpha subunit